MALIKCPECGKERVSDSAEVCPECGYGIKTHFDNIRKEKESKRLENEIKQQEYNRLKSIPRPEKPVFNKWFKIYLIILTVCSLCNMLYRFITYNGRGILISCVTFCVYVVIPFGIYYSRFAKRVKKYNFAQSDFEEYQKQIIREQDVAIASAQVSTREEAIKPECPYCHSHNTIKITTTAKVVNVAMFGVLGQKRKYQWHCNKCKSNF